LNVEFFVVKGDATGLGDDFGDAFGVVWLEELTLCQIEQPVTAINPRHSMSPIDQRAMFRRLRIDPDQSAFIESVALKLLVRYLAWFRANPQPTSVSSTDF